MIPVFETERLVLRGVTKEDAPAYERHFVDYEIIKNLTKAVPWPYPKDGAIDLWRDGKPENRGFWLGRKFWGRGLMTEAVEPVMNYAFDELGFEKLIFANAVGNDKSRRVKEKTGARLLYTEPKSFVSPEFTEHEVWELTKEEWKNFQKQKQFRPPEIGKYDCNP